MHVLMDVSPLHLTSIMYTDMYHSQLALTRGCSHELATVAPLSISMLSFHADHHCIICIGHKASQYSIVQ